MKKIYYCHKCGSTYGAEEKTYNRCPDCDVALKETDYTTDVWHTLTDEEKSKLKETFKQLCVSTTADNAHESKVAVVIRIIAGIVGILSFIGGITLFDYSFAIGISCILVELLFVAVCFGIAEICDLLLKVSDKLESVDNKLSK